jgi:serine/threonine protein kinase
MSLPAPRGLEAVGAYQLLDDLGAAPWGTVYRALDTRCDLPVLLKLVPPSLRGGELDGVSWEAAHAATETLGRIYHRHLPAVTEMTEDGDGGLLVAFAPAGHTLRELPERLDARFDARFDANSLADWGERLADALGEAHAHGLVHGQVREDEVLFGPEGEPVLAGFGLTRLAFAPAPPGVPAAVAPAAGARGPHDDVAALAAMLLRLGRAARLADGEPVMRVLARAAAPGPARMGDDSSAAALSEALRALRRSESDPTPGGRRPEDLPAATEARALGDRRNVLLLLAAALLLVLLALGAGWLLLRHDPPAPLAPMTPSAPPPAATGAVLPDPSGAPPSVQR